MIRFSQDLSAGEGGSSPCPIPSHREETDLLEKKTVLDCEQYYIVYEDAAVGHKSYIDGSHQTPDILITAMHDALLI